MTEVKKADDQVIDILAAAGVKCVEWRMPAEFAERPTGEPITHDDILDFHEILGGEDWFATLSEIMAMRRPGEPFVMPVRAEKPKLVPPTPVAPSIQSEPQGVSPASKPKPDLPDPVQVVKETPVIELDPTDWLALKPIACGEDSIPVAHKPIDWPALQPRPSDEEVVFEPEPTDWLKLLLTPPTYIGDFAGEEVSLPVIEVELAEQPLIDLDPFSVISSSDWMTILFSPPTEGDEEQ